MGILSILVGLHQVVAFLSPWSIVFIAGNVGGEASIGLVSYWMAIATPVATLSALPNRNFLLTANKVFSDSCLYLSRLSITAICCIFFLFVGWNIEYWFIPILVFAVKSFELLVDIPLAKLISQKRIRSISILWCCRVVTTVGPLLVAMRFESLVILIVPMCVGFILTAILFYDDTGVWIGRNEVLSSLALSISGFFVALESNMPRYILGGNNEMPYLAAYTASAFLVTGLSVAVNVILQTRLTALSACFQSGSTKDAFGMMLRVQLFFSVIWGVVCILLLGTSGGSYYLSLYKIESSDVAKEVFMFTAASGFVAIANSVLASGVMASRQYSQMLKSSIAFVAGALVFGLLGYSLSRALGAIWMCLLVQAAHASYFFLCIRRRKVAI
ncbi:hypothetical protein GYM54_06925 [Pseudomonas sp. MTM4]|uniref:hypothetical protein n=1 Tax=unclassified Pseudomonas TaxID=196821 RepID=UPI0018D1F724|nr:MULTISPECIES: hypothetical protein [unclassified Pseudomonas]MBC8651630.1 hypothetical protein [Pseudomonas sp. MT4]QXY91344.1 hypothetical protein GYM54_06925 [Pseudomonas sp. MTM4]